MLDNAYKYEDKIRELFYNVWYDPKYQYYFYGDTHSVFKLDKENGDKYCRRFVSLNKEGEVNGYIGYGVDRGCNMAIGFGAINFSEDKTGFGRDLAQCIDDIFTKFQMNRMEFSVVIGNPVEASYDRLVKKIGGRILCVRHDVTLDMAGNYCDDKTYEIMRKDYLAFKERRKNNANKS